MEGELGEGLKIDSKRTDEKYTRFSSEIFKYPRMQSSDMLMSEWIAEYFATISWIGTLQFVNSLNLQTTQFSRQEHTSDGDSIKRQVCLIIHDMIDIFYSVLSMIYFFTLSEEYWT